MKSKTADLIYHQTLETTPEKVAKTALKIMNVIQGEKVCNQILGLASLFICMLHQYDLSYTEMLGLADNMVYSGENNNMISDFKAIRKYMKNEWEI